MVDFKKEVEAILFSSGRTVLVNEFQSLLGVRAPGLIKEAIKELIEEYTSRDSPIMIIEEGEGWKLNVKEKFLPTVQKINPHTELSKTILETLAVIAWKQPVLQSEVIRIRTNKAYEHIAELENLGFVSKDKHSRSFILKVTEKFLDYFDLPSTKEIKDVFKDFRDINVAVQKKVDEFEKDKKDAVGQATLVVPGETSVAGADATGAATVGADGVAVQQSIDVNQPSVQVENLQGTNLETFSDTLPELHLPKKVTDLEVFDLPPEEVKQEQEKEDAEDTKEKIEDESDVVVVETTEEKARRLARELLEEDARPIRHDEEVLSRSLHPKLEEFIAGSSSEERKFKSGGLKKPDVKSKKSVSVDADSADVEKSSNDDDEVKIAEEFPGQFSDEEESK